MGARLNGNTVVRHPDTLVVVTLHAGETLPEWAVGQVGNHLLDGSPEPETSQPTPSADPPAPADPAPEPATKPAPEPTPALTEPPRAGRGSGADVWKAYAESLGVTVPADAGRDQIIELVDER